VEGAIERIFVSQFTVVALFSSSYPLLVCQGYVFRITGGNDKQGFPMVQGIMQNKRVRLLLGKGESTPTTPIACSCTNIDGRLLPEFWTLLWINISHVSVKHTRVSP
jgi:hypothetical protein